MQTNEEKRPGQKLQTVPSTCRLGSQEQETGGQANDAFQDSGSPVQRGKLLGSASFHVINHCQRQSNRGKRQINPPVGTGRVMHCGHQEKQQRRGVRHQRR